MPLKHKKTSTIPDTGAPVGAVLGSDWNDDHTFSYSVINSDQTLGTEQFIYCATDGVGGGASDPYYKNVVLHFPMESNLLDTTSNNGSGNTIVSSQSISYSAAGWSSPPYGSGSAFINNTSVGQIVINDRKEFTLSGDFTIELWVKFTTLTAGNAQAFIVSGASNSHHWGFGKNGSHQIQFLVDGNALATSTNSLVANTNYHLAVTRSGSTLRLFINGTLETTATNSLIYDGSTSLYLGYAGVGFAGGTHTWYFKDARITNGNARYTANFTPNTTAFPTYAGLLNITLPSSVATGKVYRINNGPGPYVLNFLGNGHDINSTGTTTYQPSFTPKQTYDIVYDGGKWIIP